MRVSAKGKAGKAEPRKRVTVEAASRRTAVKAAPARVVRESKPGPNVKASAKAGAKGAKAR